MRQSVYIYLILATIIFISQSCSNKQYQALFEQKRAISDTIPQNNNAQGHYYRIKPQDILQIRNLQNSKNIVDIAPSSSGTTALSGQADNFQVENDGSVALTGLGNVHVAGLTRAEAQQLIGDLYRKTFLKSPIIELKIVNLKVTVLGEMKSQGDFPLIRDKTTLVELVGQAGGLTEKADETNIKIIRGTGENPQVTVVDLSNIQSINDPKAILQNGDIIYVGKNNRATRNEKIQNFSVIFQPAILLFNTALIIVSLIRR
ncbi:MAG: polysaccharide biosynthesis/export family protein [Sphingobacteriales bacterium]